MTSLTVWKKCNEKKKKKQLKVLKIHLSHRSVDTAFGLTEPLHGITLAALQDSLWPFPSPTGPGDTQHMGPLCRQLAKCCCHGKTTALQNQHTENYHKCLLPIPSFSYSPFLNSYPKCYRWVFSAREKLSHTVWVRSISYVSFAEIVIYIFRLSVQCAARRTHCAQHACCIFSHVLKTLNIRHLLRSLSYLRKGSPHSTPGTFQILAC